MNVEAKEVVDVAIVEEDINAVAVAEAETEAQDEVTIPINYLFHKLMEILFLKIRNMKKVNINHFFKINKLQLKNKKVRLVG